MDDDRPLLSDYDPLAADMRAMVDDASLCLDKIGWPWRYLLKDFGAWETVRIWPDRFRADGIWSEIAGLLTRAVRCGRERQPEPSTAILASQSVRSGPQAGTRGYDGNKKPKGIKRHVLTCSLSFVLASLVTAASVHDTQAAGQLFDCAARNGWAPEGIKVDGIYVGARMEEAAASHGLDIQVTTRERNAKASSRSRCAGASRRRLER